MFVVKYTLDPVTDIVGKGYQIMSQKLTNWGTSFIEMMPNLLVASLIMFVFYRLAQLARKVVKPLVIRMLGNDMIASIIGGVVYYFVLFEGLFIALNTLHLDQTVTQLLAGAGILGLALSFAFQSIATNMISGIIIAAQRPFKIGDLIETNGHMGKVSDIGLRTVTLTTFDGNQVMIPSKEIVEKPLKNYDSSDRRRVMIRVGVSYAEDLERVKQITLDAITPLPMRLPESSIDLFYQEFGDSSVNFDLYFWIGQNDQQAYFSARSAAIVAIRRAYAQHDITIPFPIRTLDFGIKGGIALDQVPIRLQKREG